MADNTNNWVFVDDRDPGIAYSGPPGAVTILWHGGVAQEYDQTTTGLDPGDTLTYYFNASRIAVFGTYGPTGESGPNVAVYQVDNTPAATVTVPVAQTTLYRQNFWTSDPNLPSLAPGAFHKLFVNATSPNNTLWIDYLAYPPTNVSATSTPTTSFTIAAPTNTAVGQPGSGTSNTGTSNTKTNIGAIAAGVVVGTVTSILVIAALVYLRRRRPRPPAGEHLMQGEIGASPNMSYNHHTLIRTVTPHRPLSEGAPSYSSIPQQERPRDQLPRPLPTVPGPVRTFDGGVRLMGGPLEIPPEYQEHY